MSASNTKKTNVSKGENQDKKKRKKFVILFIILIIIALAGFGVAIFFLVKSCKPGEKEGFNIKVIQPTSKSWKLTVNGQENELNVDRGTQLDIVLAPIKTDSDPEYSCFDKTNADPIIYYAQVSSQKDPQTEIWKSSQLKAEGNKYVTSFKMNWSFDIVIQITSDSDYEKFIYTKKDDKIAYTYGESIYDINSPIYRINTETLEEETIERKEFSDNLWIGKKVKNIDAHFLAGCSGFNGTIDFQNGICETIGDNFLFGCSEFDQPIEFPESLTEITGNFMYECTSFNQPIDTKNIQYMNRYANTTFLMGCTSFNSPITFGEKLEQIPSYFLCACTKYNQNITIPKTIKTIGDGFLRNCDSMVSMVVVDCPESAFDFASENMCTTNNPLAPCFASQKGIIIGGTSSHEWVTHFPYLNDTVHNMYRKLTEN